MRNPFVVILEICALAGAVTAALLVTVVAPGSRHRPPFSPSVLGGQPPGAVVLAREDDDLAVALALAPAAKGLLAVVTVLGRDGTGASGLTVGLGVTTADGRSTAAAAEEGPLGTYQAVLGTSGRPTSASVTVSGTGSSNKPMRFALPESWPPEPATALMKEVDAAYARLKTLVIHEHLASDPAHAVDSVYRAVAPSTLEIASSDGSRAIVIGDRRWDNVGGGWRESAQSPPVEAIAPYWAGIVQDPTVLGSERVGGRAAWAVSFAAPQIPAFFRIDVDKATNRTLALEMTASAHFMHHVYGPFDSPLTIEPPFR